MMKTYLVQRLLLLMAIVGLVGCTVPSPTAEAPVATTLPETRTITHALGATEIIGTPERVVTLEWSYTEDLLALVLQPAGVADIAGYNSYVVQDDNNVFQRESVRPLWESIDFVQNGNAYPLGGDTWLFGGPLSAEVLVDIVVEALTSEPVS